MIAPQGRVYWAVAPFSPQPPFRIFREDGREPLVVETREIVDVARAGDAQFDVIVPVKARPVLVLTGVIGPYDDVLALRLRRLEKLSSAGAQRVREHRDDTLFHLPPTSFPDLPTENAAMVTTLLRLPATALDTRRELGQLDAEELRSIHGRLVRVHGLELDALIRADARALAQLMREHGP